MIFGGWLVEARQRNASSGVVVQDSVVVGGIASDAATVVCAVEAVVGTLGAGETLTVHLVPRLTLALAGTSQTQVIALNTG